MNTEISGRDIQTNAREGMPEGVLSKAPQNVASLTISVYVDSTDSEENNIYRETYSADATSITLTLPAGANRIIKCEAEDSNGITLYTGKSEPFDLVAGSNVEITITMGNADYTIEVWTPLLSGATSSAISGGFTIHNNAIFDGSEAITWELYVSSDAAYDAGDTLADSGTINALPAYTTSSAVPYSGTWMAASAGTYPKSYYLILRISAVDDMGTGIKEQISSTISVRLKGKILYNDLSDNLWIVNTDGTDKTQVGTITVSPSPVRFSLSPDYTTVAYVPLGFLDELWTVNAADGTPIASPLFVGPNSDLWSPQYSPDGSSILLWESVPVTHKVYIINSATGVDNYSANFNYDYLSWSPDGSQVAYVDIGPPWQIGTANANLTGWSLLAPVVDSNLARPMWSPDGTKLLYTDGDDIYETLVSGGPGSILVAGGGSSSWASPCYSPEGTHIAYADAWAFVLGIIIADADGSNPQVIPGTTDASTSLEWR